MGLMSQMCLKQVVAIFRKAWLWGRVGGRGSWQQQTFHTTPPRGRGESRACSNSTFIKTYWRKTTCWSMAGGGENQHDGWIQPPSHCVEACASKLPWKFHPFHFSSSLPSSFSNSIYCCSNSCPAITTQPTPLISLPSFVLSRPSSRPHSINLLVLHFLSHGLIYVHPLHVSPSQLQDPQILLSGNSVMLLPHCPSCPVFCMVSCGFR